MEQLTRFSDTRKRKPDLFVSERQARHKAREDIIAEGSRWLTRLARSEWFADLRSRARIPLPATFRAANGPCQPEMDATWSAKPKPFRVGGLAERKACRSRRLVKGPALQGPGTVAHAVRAALWHPACAGRWQRRPSAGLRLPGAGEARPNGLASCVRLHGTGPNPGDQRRVAPADERRRPRGRSTTT